MYIPLLTWIYGYDGFLHLCYTVLSPRVIEVRVSEYRVMQGVGIGNIVI